MLNLDLLDGISFTKGCYTGQEIVARTQHLGRIKRRSLRLRLAAPAPIGAALRFADGRVARLIELQPADDRFEGLAVAPITAAGAGDAGEEAPVAAGALAAEELPLPYSLAPRAL